MIPTYTTTTPSTAVNPYLGSQTAMPHTIQTFFVNNINEAINSPNPTFGCALYLNQNELEMYAKYSDGRSMETYTLVKKEPPAPPEYVTKEDLDKKFEELMNMLKKHNNYIPRKEKHDA